MLSGMEESGTHSEDKVITLIEQQKRNHQRYNIYINNDYSFAVHQDILVKYRLMKGMSIDREFVEEILLAEERNRAEQYALRYLGFRPRTKQEMITYLTAKGFDAKDCQDVVDQLLKRGYLNDELYAEQWISERKRLKPRGRYLLKQELLHKGIEEPVVEDVSARTLSDSEEKEMILLLIEKKFSNHKFANSYAMKKKIIPYLQRKGFPLDTILSVIYSIQRQYIKND
jgi:regulatory protein